MLNTFNGVATRLGYMAHQVHRLVDKIAFVLDEKLDEKPALSSTSIKHSTESGTLVYYLN